MIPERVGEKEKDMASFSNFHVFFLESIQRGSEKSLVSVLVPWDIFI
jgi:hypothetical protein